MKILGLALSLVIGFASTANAGIFAEPYLGYGFGSTEDDSTPPTKTDITGPVLGARVGGEFAMLFIGADYSMSLGAKAESSGVSSDIDLTNLYGVVGANLPIIRAWVGVGLMNEATVKGTPDTKFHGGSHFKLGLGFKVIPMLSLNAEYLMANYKKFEQGALTGTTDIKGNTVLISASLPLSW